MQLEPFALERWMTTYEMRVRYDIAESGIFPLSTDELLSFAPPADRESFLAELLATRLGYSEACGSLALRTALAATYADATPDHILVTTGAIEANFLLCQALLKPGDHVVAPYPAYQQLYELPRALGCELALWELRAENGFRFDLDELERLVTPRTRLIIINSPHNPTGALLSAEDLRRVYGLAEAAGAYVLSDEAYRWLEHPGGAPLPPPLFNLGSQGISVGTCSKPFGLPGVRIGWLAAPPDLVAACWGLRDYITLSPGKLNDALARLALEQREHIIARNQAIIARNLATVHGWLDEQGGRVSWVAPRAGLLGLLRYTFDVPSLDLANRLAEEYSVMLAPGSVFGYEHHLRIGIGQEPDIFAEGLRRTGECFARLG